MDGGIDYVVERYNELFDLLSNWGYEVIPDPDLENWSAIVRASTDTGHVKLTGVRNNWDGTSLTFKFEEFWVKGDRGDEAVMVRGDGSLWGCFYHGQAPTGGMRWCVDRVGHPGNPSHVHPFALPEGADAVPCEPVSAWEALEMFEQHAYLDDCGPSEDE